MKRIFKKKKGFTIIEVLGIIIILGIILAITVPGINSVINNSYTQTYEIDLTSMENAARNYVLEKNIVIADGIQIKIELYDIQEANFIDEILDPKTKEPCDGYVTVTKIGDTYKFHPYLSCGVNYQSENYNKTDFVLPIILLIGDNPFTLKVGETYQEPGVIATDDVDGLITDRVVATGNINPNTPGVYKITYNVKDNAGNDAVSVERTINVIDTEGPIITFGTNGNTTYAKDRSTIVRVRDNASVNTSSLKYQWNTSPPAPIESSFTTTFTSGATLTSPVGATGSYYLWIIAKDSSGNTTITKSNVFNLDNTKPVIIINGSNPVIVNKGSTYTDAGATAADNVDGSLTLTITGTINPNVVGSYSISYSATDSSGNTNTVTRTINVIDVLAPVITINGSNPLTINAGSTYSDAGATAVDDVDGNVTSKIITTGTVNPSVVGTYTITYTVKDNANNTSSATRTINVIDIIAPAVAFGTNGNSTYAKTRSTTVTVSDAHSGVNTSSLKYQWKTCTTAPIESSFTTTFANGATLTSPVGVTESYYLWILAKDNAGNTTIIKTNVFNLDNTIPVITLIGNSILTVNAGTTYTDAGSTATDNINGDITSSIVKTGSVNTNTVGTYTLTYNVSDSSGNAAASVTRTVTVVDATIPSVAFGTNGNSTYAKTRSTTVTVSDAHTGVNTSSLKYIWNTSATVPTEASFSTTFTNGGTLNTPAGVTGGYYLWILAKDNAGNTTIVKTNVFNLDNTIPVIALNGSASVTINKGSTYTDAGSTATDNINGTITSSIVTTGTVNPSVVGTYTIRYNVSDSSGNAATTVTRTVNVKDVLAPTITITGSNPITIAAGSTYSDAGATATDDVDGNVTSKITTTSTVNTSTGGSYTVTYRVVDNAGNVATSTRTVIVKYCSSGTITYNASLGYVCLKSATANTTCNSCTYTTTTYGQNCSACGSTCNSCTYIVSTSPSSTAATASKSCSDGASYVSSVDRCRIYTSDRVYSCSSGSVSGTNCVVAASSSRYCSDGASYVSSVDRCRIYTSSRVYSCSSGTLDGTQCKTTSLATPTCSSGTFISGSGCKNYHSYSTGSACSSACSTTCASTNGSPPWLCPYYTSASCPSGYSMNSTGTSCYKYTYTAASVSCPSGWSMSSADNCYQNTVTPSTSYSCSSGTLSGTNCIVGSASVSCPSGWSMSSADNCYQNTVTPTTTYSCSSGSFYMDNCYSCSGGTQLAIDMDNQTVECLSTTTAQNCSNCGSTCNSCNYSTTATGSNCSSCGSTTTYSCGSWTYYDGYDSGTRCYTSAQ